MHRVELYNCTKPDLPILFVAGEDDPCIGGKEGLKDSIDTLKQAGYRKISKKLYHHMRHEILQETDNEVVFREIRKWLKSGVIG